jgi:integral membrane protein (TIGR01906 family)
VRTRVATAAEATVVGVLWAALVVGLAVGALTVPVYTSAMVQTLKVPESAGLTIRDTVQLSGLVRALVADAEYDPRPPSWNGQPAFDAAAVSHLIDVREVLAGARAATGVAAAVLAIWLSLAVARKRWRPLARGMRAGAYVVLGVMALSVAAAFLDFSTFFAAFHSLFFESGTWQFPADSLLIRLFPEPFWVASGIAWGALSAGGAGLLLVAARIVPPAASSAPKGAPSEDEPSRTADNV